MIVYDYIYILIFMLAGIFLVGAALTTARFLRSQKPTREKLTTYECGERPIGTAWVQYNVLYYIFAVLFVVFDVEVLFIVPWACVFKELSKTSYGMTALVEMLIFLAILAFALVYAWRKGALEWER